jgi:hypothetical protein
MNEPEIESLLSFWRQRQANFPPSEIFRWSHVQVGGKKSPERVLALYPNIHAQEEAEDDSSHHVGESGSRKVGARKKKGKGKKKKKKSAETVEDDVELPTLGSSLCPPVDSLPDRAGPIPNGESILQGDHINSTLEFSSPFIPGPAHVSPSPTHFGPNDQPYQLDGICGSGPNDDAYLPPFSGPNDHLYTPAVYNNGFAGVSLLEELHCPDAPDPGGMIPVIHFPSPKHRLLKQLIDLPGNEWLRRVHRASQGMQPCVIWGLGRRNVSKRASICFPRCTITLCGRTPYFI